MSSVDVLIPNYNYGRYLRACAGSVLSQDIDLRLLIIDNASTDDSARIAHAIAAGDPRVELRLHRENLGPHSSFNEGIDWAQADYFLILCADDLLAPGALARAAAAMDDHPDVHLTFGQWLAIGPDSPTPAADSHPARDWRILSGLHFLERACESGRNPCPGPTCVVRTAVQKAVGHYRPSLPHTDDLEMWMRFACHGKIAETSAVQAFARVHEANQSASVADLPRWNREFAAAFDSFFANEGAALAERTRLQRLARRSLGESAYWSGLASLARGEYRVGFDLIRFAVHTAPRTAILPPIGRLLRRPDWRQRISMALGARRTSGKTVR
ncbi:glycosyltransferase family A protein [Mesorhizobium sp. RMAD-H1]|uniref:glycosyltransferase family A protein n=1 Tax=Mesorhizobium sp. RMAD-H1 TaxID=2587065 RepID=UPI001608137E|nr:glycosyltransferase family A protein [Mesorhizobium sp. RMAD-H1]MBB2969601.1 glycosyltransferase involved in cell wall biosynthesis [Mesorhizobium sp. RMAD-H1]